MPLYCPSTVASQAPPEITCPPECGAGVGAFVKTRKSPELILKEMKEKEEQAKANAVKGDPQPTDTSLPEETQLESSVQTYTIPSLKPGPDGKVDWTPLGDLTGTRPAVSKYSINRYSLDEWRNHNNKLLSNDTITESNIIDYNAKTVMMQAFGNIDKLQRQTNDRLKQKARDIFRWKSEVEEAHKMMTLEVETLEKERQRLKGASRMLMLPESILRECLALRSNRAVPDLVEDLAEQELFKEMELINKVREILKTTLQKIEDQMAMNKAAKHRLEYDWSAKMVAYDTETTNLRLTSKSHHIMFAPGGVKYGEYTSPLEYWEYYCRKNIEDCESVRQKSVDLRGTLNAILTNNGKMLRNQADRTDIMLAEKVAGTKEQCTTLEENLRATLQKIADMESLIHDLQDAVRKTDASMKLAQTRIVNRNIFRPNGENVRDLPHVGLIEEVKTIHETATSLLSQIKNAERVRNDLMNKRIELEREIASKRNTLNIDGYRCGMVRSHYPSASELAGVSFK